MKYPVLIPVFLIINSVHAATLYVDEVYYDCHIEGQTAVHSYLHKDVGMTVERMKKLLVKILNTEAKKMYLYYSSIGFRNKIRNLRIRRPTIFAKLYDNDCYPC